MTALKINVPNSGTQNLILKKSATELKDINLHQLLTVSEFSTQLSPTDRSYEEKVNRETPELIDIKCQMDITDTYRIFSPNTKIIYFILQNIEAFVKINHILKWKTNHHKQKKIEITPWVLFNHNAIKYKTDNKSLVDTQTNGDQTMHYNMMIGSKKKSIEK